MSNSLYDSIRKDMLDGNFNWGSLTIKAVLVDSGVTGFNASHVYRSSISSAEVGTATALTGKSTTGGAADAADTTFSSVSGASCEAVVLFDDTGTPATSRLIAWIDSATGLPITPNGGDIIVVWDNGTNKIFRP